MIRFITTINPTFNQALCKQHDNNIWFDAHTERKAISICERCPELEQCRQYALTLPEDTVGVFAGLTAKQLQPLRKANGNPKYIEHGTTAGYYAHLRAGEKACQACLRANATNKSERFAKYRQTRKDLVAGKFEHGTASGYTKHYLYGIPPCDDCKKAKAAYMREHHARKQR